jgi:hypothetical protein
MAVNRDDIIALRNGVELRKYVQGRALFSFCTGQAFEVNYTAWRVIELLDKHLSIAALIDLLAKEFKVSAEEIANDVTAYLEDCINLGIMTAGCD